MNISHSHTIPAGARLFPLAALAFAAALFGGDAAQAQSGGASPAPPPGPIRGYGSGDRGATTAPRPPAPVAPGTPRPDPDGPPSLLGVPGGPGGSSVAPPRIPPKTVIPPRITYRRPGAGTAPPPPAPPVAPPRAGRGSVVPPRSPGGTRGGGSEAGGGDGGSGSGARGVRPSPGATRASAAGPFVLSYRCPGEKEKRFQEHNSAERFQAALRSLGVRTQTRIHGYAVLIAYEAPAWHSRNFSDLERAKAVGRALRGLGFEVQLRAAQ